MNQQTQRWVEALRKAGKDAKPIHYSRPRVPVDWPLTHIDTDGLTCPVCGYYGQPMPMSYAVSLLEALSSALADTMQEHNDTDPGKRDLLQRTESYLKGVRLHTSLSGEEK